MNLLNHMRLSNAKKFVIALQIMGKFSKAHAPILFLGKFITLNHGAHSAIQDKDAFIEKAT